MGLGAVGSALHFDGTNDDLTIPVINGEMKTLALWLQPDPGTGVRPVISVGSMSRIRLNDPLGSVGLMIDQNTSTFAQSPSTGNLVSSDWVHLALLRWNGGTNSYQILIDGGKIYNCRFDWPCSLASRHKSFCIRRQRFQIRR